jgi:hypothetical protein
MDKRKMARQVMKLHLILKMDILRASGNFTKKKEKSTRTQKKTRMEKTKDRPITMMIGLSGAYTLRT